MLFAVGGGDAEQAGRAHRDGAPRMEECGPRKPAELGGTGSERSRPIVENPYLAFSPKDTFEFEGRLVLYGIPSSQAQEICQSIARDVGTRLGVDAECFQGTVG